MKTSLKTLATVLALAIFGSTPSPCVAGEEPNAEDAKVPVIRVVVDHENHLALVPEGTVLPGGLQILSSAGLKAESSDVVARGSSAQRPLVFAYAPAGRFAGLEPVEIPQDGSSEVVELSVPAEREANATNSVNPCPVTIVVEFGPELIHEMTCSYTSFGAGQFTEKLVSYSYYPTTARRSTITTIVDYASQLEDSIHNKVCVIPAGACTSTTMYFGVPFAIPTNIVSNASVRLLGACIQDPPFCPVYTSSIVLPVLAP